MSSESHQHHDHDHADGHDHDHAPDPSITATATEESPVAHRVEVRIERKRVRKAFDRAYRDLAKQARVKGFRPGKAPRPVLERLYRVRVDPAGVVIHIGGNDARSQDR